MITASAGGETFGSRTSRSAQTMGSRGTCRADMTLWKLDSPDDILLIMKAVQHRRSGSCV